MNPKRVLAIHDLSGVGRCSLTVALPILSACGLEACALPTAVLSTHTGGFSDYTYRDLTNDMEAMAAHWRSLGLHFDAVYSGYLGSQQQLSILSELLSSYRLQNSLILLDPVMADEGKLYTHFNTEFVNGMRSLCSYADIIVPNMTEAALLLNVPYQEPPYSLDYIRSTVYSLYELCHASVVLTGVAFNSKQLGAAVYDAASQTFSLCLNQMIEGVYYGTGDVFASALLGAYLKNADLTAAAQIAVDFTLDCIIRTEKSGADPHYGVQFEPELHSLIIKLERR
ncbi:MAG: pyridoxamine kinase [Clostridiales bacterium]|nr:pyridoxamine kinase [Clostridiales bacterium]